MQLTEILVTWSGTWPEDAPTALRHSGVDTVGSGQRFRDRWFGARRDKHMSKAVEALYRTARDLSAARRATFHNSPRPASNPKSSSAPWPHTQSR